MTPGGAKGLDEAPGAISFLRAKYPYFLGLAVVEAGIYYFDGPKGNFTTGLLGLFTIWLYYSWIGRH